jgi:hypothetical protein
LSSNWKCRRCFLQDCRLKWKFTFHIIFWTVDISVIKCTNSCLSLGDGHGRWKNNVWLPYLSGKINSKLFLRACVYDATIPENKRQLRTKALCLSSLTNGLWSKHRWFFLFFRYHCILHYLHRYATSAILLLSSHLISTSH